MYFKMNVAPYGNILSCILHKVGYHDSDTILLMESSSQQENFENKRCLLDIISHFCISRNLF